MMDKTNEKRIRPILWIVVPCYNEQEVLPITAPLFLEQLQSMKQKGLIHEKSRILFVDDGSTDQTWSLIETFSRENKNFLGMAQSRNRGHQSTILAGMMEAQRYSDITITIDCDGQDDPGAMQEMVKQYLEGSDIVYGVRSDRESDTWFKRNTAQGFYRFLNHMGAEVVYNHADYRLVSTRVLKVFEEYEEVNLYLRGMFPLVGFRSTCVYYVRRERAAGVSHYPLHKMLRLAFNGITSLSIRPIHLITLLGFLVAVVSFIGVIWSLVAHLSGNTVQGWTSMTAIICFLGGIQLLSLGVIGEYVGKTYMETKHRPRYIISDRTYNMEEVLKSLEKGKESD